MFEDALVFLVGTLAGGIRLGTILLFAALGETFAERSGVFNLGVEGTMLIAAFASFWAAYTSGNLWVGVFVGILTGALMAAIMCIVSVKLRADQIVSGIAITLFGIGMSIFLYKAVFGTTAPMVEGFGNINIPSLSDIPIIGQILFEHNALVYLGFILVPICSIVLFNTTLGLKIQAVGENPAAADAAGISVYRIRYLSVILGGAMAGLAGAFLSLGYLTMFTENMTAGRGWIAVVVVIFGRWSPYRVLGGSILFGVIEALQLHLQRLNTGIPLQALSMLPYITAVVVLLIVYRKQKPPAALGIPYKRD